MLEEAADELFSGDRTTLNLIGGRLFISESDVPIFQLAQAVVADSDAKDVRGEILEGLCATADGFGMNYPILAPEVRSNCREQPGLFQCIAKLGAEDHGQRFDGHEKVGARGAPAALGSEAAAGDDVMNVRMI